MTDPISDMLTRIRNAYLVKKPEVILPHSGFKQNLAGLLVNHGWLMRMEVLENGGKRNLKLVLKYDPAGEPALVGVERVSRPGQRIYSGRKELGKSRSRLGMAIVSTSRGLMTDREARAEKIGGEVICQIW